MKKQYKALMLDLDGTTIPNKKDGHPSKKVAEAIRMAKEKLHVGFISARPYFSFKEIAKEVLLDGPSIASGGAQIIDTVTDKIVWQKNVPKEELGEISKILNKYRYQVIFQIGGRDQILESTTILLPPEIICFSIMDVRFEDIEKISNELKNIPNIALTKIIGWKTGTYWLQVSHAEATKQHGIWEVAKILGIETHEIIGVGDSYNDFPLLMACGLKVAMGNANPELKEIADYVAPTVDADGVADVIEKFVL